jgi:hypothetical protein
LKKLLLLIPILYGLGGPIARAQSVNVALGNFALDDKARKMQAIIAVYRYTGQPFEDPFNNGIESKDKPHTFTAKLPDLKGARDTNYAFFYFGGIASNTALPGYVFSILTQNSRGSKPCLMWIDRNYNLDLTDDGAPDSFFFNTPFRDISFTNPGKPELKYTVRISRFPFNYNTKYIWMLDDYYRDNSGSKKFAGALYSFREERLNVKAGDYLSGNDSFRIALKDVNCNGIYNEPGIDYVVLGNYKSSTLQDAKVPINEKEGRTYFEREGKHYDIGDIDPLGRSVTVTLNTGARIHNALRVGKKIKKFRFATTGDDKKKVSIKKFRKKPTYIYVWRAGDEDFMKDTAALGEISSKYADRVNLVTLNYGQTPKELKSFQKRQKVGWLLGFSSARINKQLFIEKYPTGILTKKGLRVKQIGLSARELLNLLNSNTL